MPSFRSNFRVIATATLLAGCTDTSSGSQENLEARAILDVKTFIADELGVLNDASTGLQTAAPEPDADGWSMQTDAAAVESMREHWRDCRISYERIEGAIAVLFPNYDASTDERYDGFIEAAPDDNLFDGQGVTGVHAVERILWADSMPDKVVEFESALPNFAPAAFPTTEANASDFKDGLTARFVDDTAAMRRDFEPLALDAASAFRGVIGSMQEQAEKVNLATSGEDESRYAQHTLADMRANLEGAQAVFEAFTPWLSQAGGDALIDEIRAGFDRVDAAYERVPGDAIPTVPDTWNPDAPTAEDLGTPYGELWQLLADETDPAIEASLVANMNEAAELLGIPVI